MRALAATSVALLALAWGCGGDSGSAGSALVDPDVDPPVNSLEAEPGSSALLLTTNRGFYRVENGTAARIEATAKTPDGQTPVGTFLVVSAHGERGLIASGHPDRTGKIADFLGALASDDGGESWRIISRYALADLHVIHEVGDDIYAFDAVLDSLLVSSDGGRSWQERGGPPERVVDFVVDPSDSDHMLAATRKELFRSTDGGNRWSATVGADSARLAWADDGALRRIDADGLVYASDNAGASWELIEQIEGEPWRLLATESGQLYAALADATILSSSDGGGSWQEHFSP